MERCEETKREVKLAPSWDSLHWQGSNDGVSPKHLTPAQGGPWRRWQASAGVDRVCRWAWSSIPKLIWLALGAEIEGSPQNPPVNSSTGTRCWSLRLAFLTNAAKVKFHLITPAKEHDRHYRSFYVELSGKGLESRTVNKVKLNRHSSTQSTNPEKNSK